MNLPRDCAGTSPSRSTVAARSTWCAIDECPPLALKAGSACPGLAGGSPRRRTSPKSGGRSPKAKTMTPAARGYPTSPFNRAPPRRCLLQASRRLLPSYLPSPWSSLPDLPERCLALCYPRLPSNPPRALRSLLNRRLHPYQLSTRSLLVAPTEPRVLLTVALPSVPLSFWSPLILPETEVEISPKHPLLWSVLSFLFPSPTPQNCLHPRVFRSRPQSCGCEGVSGKLGGAPGAARRMRWGRAQLLEIRDNDVSNWPSASPWKWPGNTPDPGAYSRAYFRAHWRAISGRPAIDCGSAFQRLKPSDLPPSLGHS